MVRGSAQPDIPNPNIPFPDPSPLVPRSLTVVPPSWRRDLTREIDLIEEVGRIHGYEAIPEDVGVPMVPSARRREDRVLERVRHVLTAAGFDEAVTLSAVDERTSALLSPWTDAEPLRSVMPVVRGADCLRRSLVPSLLAARRTNEALANAEIELFEIARAYLPRGGELPREELLLGITSGRDYLALRGVIEAILGELKVAEPLEADDAGLSLLDPAASCRLRLRNETLGFVGRLTAEALRQSDLRGPAQRGRDQAGAAGGVGGLGAALRSAIALSGREPRLESRGGRAGPLGGRRGDRAPARRRVLRVAGVPRHVPRPRAARQRPEEPLVHDHAALGPKAR